MTEIGNPKNQPRGFPLPSENAQNAFPTFPQPRLLLLNCRAQIHSQKGPSSAISFSSFGLIFGLEKTYLTVLIFT
jgi:hypothetical protein